MKDPGHCACSTIKRLGLHKEKGQHDEMAFVAGTVSESKTCKVLLKKNDKHRDSTMHKKCAELFKSQQND
jgi:hypothetical protein